VALGRETGSKRREAVSSLTCADIAIEQGRLEEAEGLAQRAADVLLTERQPHAEADAYHVLSQAYLAGAKLDEARRALARAAASPQYSIADRLPYATTAARLRAADAPADAVAALRAVVDEATSSGYLRLAYEARLHLAQAERQTNQPDAARAGLERLRKDASAKGFHLIARKAATALGASSGTRPRPKAPTTMNR
jgi:tetratricopeptide (TPR) repeat protein